MEFTKEQFELAKQLAFENWKNEESDIGFEFEYTWITNPFVESSGRFEFENFETMYEYYGKNNVCDFIRKILANQ